jgi:hypothetical protein
MNIFKKKALCAARATIGALGAAGAAHAVNLNPDGLGQVLIYPYYTTRNDDAGNAFNSLLSVVNSTASVKAVKVDDVNCEADTCTVKLSLTYDYKGAKGVKQPLTITTPLTEQWIISQGQAWFVDRG